MWLLLAAFAGLMVYSSTRKGTRDHYSPRSERYYQPRYVRRRHNSPPPGPLMVLSELMARGIYPPPFVVMCALAEAQALGRLDIANDIVMTLIAPVVHQYDMQHAQNVALGPHAPGAPMGPSPYGCPGVAPPGAIPTGDPYAPPNINDDEIQTRLNMDPLRFMEDLARGAPAQVPPRTEVIDVDPSAVAERPGPAAEPNTDQQGNVQNGDVKSGGSAVVSGAIDMTRLASPIAGVNALDWSRFCDLLVREAPTFTSGRHVGQYRQNKDRLAELGIRPESLVGRPDLQQKALDRDLADAYHHVRASGMLKHVGRVIALPGVIEPARITLSGLLGLIQAAGLDGADGWLEHSSDRRRFKHTTQAFTRSNGVF